MKTDLMRQIGQCFVGGFPGTEISQEFRRLVKEYKIGNVILFKHNIADKQQLKGLCREINELIFNETGYLPFIMIDQEGGVVTRLPKECHNAPGAMALAATGSIENVRLAAEITARELKDCGVNFNLAPDADINSNPDNPVIGVRSYGDNPYKVAELVSAAVEGYQKEGIAACAKHFPGHGDTAVDSHLGLPVVDKSLEELEKLECIPFAEAISRKVTAIMSSHILFPKLEPERIPCTMSRRIITGLLKEKMGFGGLVISDCLEMDAIKEYYGVATGAVKAIAAGVDIVCVSHTAVLQEAAVSAVIEAVDKGAIDKDELVAAVNKIIRYKKDLLQGNRENEYLPEDSVKIEELYSKSITIVKGSLPALGDKPFFTGCADFRATLASNEEKGKAPFPTFMEKELNGYSFVTDRDPGREQIEEVCNAAKAASMIAVCTYNGHLNPGQKELVNSLAGLAKPMVVIALRNPYDLEKLPENVAGIAAWEYSDTTMRLLADVLRGKLVPTGELPVALH